METQITQNTTTNQTLIVEDYETDIITLLDQAAGMGSCSCYNSCHSNSSSIK